MPRCIDLTYFRCLTATCLQVEVKLLRRSVCVCIVSKVLSKHNRGHFSRIAFLCSWARAVSSSSE